MNKRIGRMIAVVVVLCLVMGLPLVSAAATARPLTTVEVNGVVSGLLFADDPESGDTGMLEVKAKMDGGSFVSGSGSMHGITCGATFFFEFTDVTVGDESLTMTGTIVRTNNGHQRFYNWAIGFPVEITANLDGSNMHFRMPWIGLDFEGSGHVVI